MNIPQNILPNQKQVLKENNNEASFNQYFILIQLKNML